MPEDTPTPPPHVLEPEYPDGEVHPHARLTDSTEPWHTATAAYISQREFTHDFHTGRKYDAPTMMKAFVYQRILGISSFHRLTSHLNSNPQVAHLLGFSDVPDGDTFREWWRTHLTESMRETTKTVVADHFKPELAEHLLDLGFPAGRSLQPHPTVEEAPSEISMAEKEDAIQHIRPLVYDLLSFGRADNASFHDNWFLDFQALISRERDFAEKNINEFHAANDPAPSAPTHFNTIQSRTGEEWMEMFEPVFERVVEVAQGAGMLNRPVELMIDGTDLPFYGRPDAEGVVGTKKSANTTWAYKHITISARAQGRTVKLASFPLRDRGKLNIAVMYLVRRAKELISVKRLLMDSEFIDVALLSWLDRQSVPFIVQYRKAGKDIKGWLQSLDGDTGAMRHVISPAQRNESLPVTLLAKRAHWGSSDDDEDGEQLSLREFGMDGVEVEDDDGGEWIVYATNIENASDDPARWAETYARRWAIETNYRVIKQDFLAKTTSRKFSVRVFYWLFAVLLYDAWVLLDVFLRADHPEKAPDDRPVMPARSFAKAFYNFDPG